MRNAKLTLGLILILALVAPMAALAQDDGPTEITMWRHISDKQNELETYRGLIADFNESQDAYEMIWEELPQESYSDSINAAAMAGELPCIIDVDGPNVPNYAWSGYLISLDDYVGDELMEDLIPSALGTYKGELYSIGQFDAGVAIYASMSALEEVGARMPTVAEPWTQEEFEALLAAFAETGSYDYPIDMGTSNQSDGWWMYFYSPVLQSFGGDLIDRDSYLSAADILNGEDAVQWGDWWRWLFGESGYANPNMPDDQGLIQGTVPMVYHGSWAYPQYSEGLGDDLVIVPVPVWGDEKPVVGGASWQWGITSSCEHPDAAWEFFEFMMDPGYVAELAVATGNIPARRSAAPDVPDYAEDGPMRVFLDEKEWVVMRPETPAFPIITSEFGNAAREIANGAPVQETLDNAVIAIDQDIADNDGYGFGE